MTVTANTTEPIQRKRRLSRKEQKELKKKRKKNGNNNSDDGENKDKLKEEKPDTATSPNTSHSTSPSTTTNTCKSQEKNEGEETDNLFGYQAIEIPTISTEINAASVGKWFPKAKLIKSSIQVKNSDKQTKAKAALLLFYQYAKWPSSKVDQLMAYLAKIAETRQPLGGRCRIAQEGVNATISSLDSPQRTASASLRWFAHDLKRFSSEFNQTDFKFIDDMPPDRHFKDFKILPVKELVFYGINEDDAPIQNGGSHVDANQFHDLLKQDDAVVIDVRNHYEAAIGRFDGQNSSGGAQYVDPKMRKSTDFVGWLAKDSTKEKVKDKKVLLYCTGGVRCERASAYINNKMGDHVKGVYQLQGGIERYLQAFPDGGHWRGKNFVFDKREAISVANRNGDGGVVDTKKTPTEKIQSNCCCCQQPWDRYIGKKKCDMCGVPVLVCTNCLTKQKKEKKLQRCPLCIEENITVTAANVEYTKNGVSSKLVTQDNQGEKAALSVLKWGGGHARTKKKKRQLRWKVCQFGSDCARKDCYFSHPERQETEELPS